MAGETVITVVGNLTADPELRGGFGMPSKSSGSTSKPGSTSGSRSSGS